MFIYTVALKLETCIVQVCFRGTYITKQHLKDLGNLEGPQGRTIHIDWA